MNSITNKETIIKFFENFPFNKILKNDEFDYLFYDNLIPMVLSDKQNNAIEPHDLNIFYGFNIFGNELKHCSLLAWFLNPGSNHCQRELFLKCFLEKFELLHLLQYIEGGYFTVSLEDNHSDYGRVDISIYNKNFWIIIEAKILAIEQDDQIERYNDILDKKSMIHGIHRSMCKVFFLTKNGRSPNSGKSDYNIRWKDIAIVLRDFANCCKNEYISSTANQYSKFILFNIGE